MLGIDYRLVQLAGSTIRATLPGIFSGNPQNILNRAMQGLYNGVISVGLNYATQELKGNNRRPI